MQGVLLMTGKRQDVWWRMSVWREFLVIMVIELGGISRVCDW